MGHVFSPRPSRTGRTVARAASAGVDAQRRRNLTVHDHDADRDDCDSEEGEEQIRPEKGLSQTTFGARLDDGPSLGPADCYSLIHRASRETPRRC